jgi:hypothetical protein
MTSREKRTTTELGLGQVTDDRRTAKRERVADGEGPPSDVPASRAPLSGAPPSARQTRGVDSVPSAGTYREARADDDRISISAPGGRPVDRRAPTQREDGKDSGEMERVVVRDRGRSQASSDTPRAPGVESSRPSHGAAGRAQRPIEGRPVARPRSADGKVSSRPPGRKSLTTRPPSGRPMSSPPAGRPLESKPPSSASPSGRPARSARASIRVDDVGAAVKSGADAIGVVSRQVPKIVRTKAEIAAAPIDHRAGFLLAHIDGVTSVQGLVDIAAMPENEVHEILERLRRLGIVALR